MSDKRLIAWISDRDEPKVFGFEPKARLTKVLNRLDVMVAGTEADLQSDDDILIFNADYVYEPAFVDHLIHNEQGTIRANDQSNSALVFARTNKAGFEQSLKRLSGSLEGDQDEKSLDQIGPIYHGTLRKRQFNLVYSLDDMPVRHIEWSLYEGAYKGVTDFFTKHVWPLPAFWLTKLANGLGLSPNMVTSISFLLTIYATYAFYWGDWAVGLMAAWGMCILDTVDGKLARVTMTSSKWGNAFDHGIDLVHPPFWYAAWGMGLIHQAGGEAALAIDMWSHLAVIVVGYVVGRLCEGIFMLVADGQDMWTWRKFDSLFRLWVSRRNPNLFLLTVSVFLMQPELGFLAVSYWTIASVIYQVVRIAQALIWRLQKRPFISWMTDQAGDQ